MLTPAIVTTNGSYVIWQRQYQVANNGPATYVFDLNIPAGAVFDSNLSGPMSTYNPLPTPTITFVGIDGSGSTPAIISIILKFQIPIVGALPYTFQVDRMSGPDTNLTNNLGIDILNVEFCPPVGGAVADPFSCVCGNVSTNDTPCSSCTSEWRYNNDIVNGTMLYFNTATGEYQSPHINPYLPITWTYNLWCINCEDGNDYDVSGPVTVTIPALFTGTPQPVFRVEQFSLLPNPIPGSFINLSTTPAVGYGIAVFMGGIHNFNWILVGNQIQFTIPIALGVNEAGPFTDIVVHYFS